MISERHETTRFTRDDLERIVRYMVQMQVSNTLVLGNSGETRVAWTDDGSIDVITTYRQVGFDELPPPVKRKR